MSTPGSPICGYLDSKVRVQIFVEFLEYQLQGLGAEVHAPDLFATLESETTSPLEGAALPMVIVMVPVFVAGRFRELGVRTMLFAAGAIVTV